MLSRTALRLATVLALSNANAAPWPTIAEGRVYDSRIDPIDLARDDKRDRLPLIIVRTETDTGMNTGAAAGIISLARDVALDIEIGVGSWVTLEGVPDPAFGTIETDAEVEAMLDLLEHQVLAALTAPTRWAGLWTGLVRAVRSWSSNRYSDPDTARLRYAERRIGLSVQLVAECGPAVRRQTSTGPTLTAANALPPPLQRIVDAIAAAEITSPYVAGVTGLLSQAGLPASAIVLPALERVRLIEADQAATAEGETGPAGARAEGVAEARPAT